MPPLAPPEFKPPPPPPTGRAVPPPPEMPPATSVMWLPAAASELALAGAMVAASAADAQAAKPRAAPANSTIFNIVFFSQLSCGRTAACRVDREVALPLRKDTPHRGAIPFGPASITKEALDFKFRVRNGRSLARRRGAATLS